tara:strand:- start:3008 stop:3466 length:459 start_codon:yes stop_codon:yes gene_type:complete
MSGEKDTSNFFVTGAGATSLLIAMLSSVRSKSPLFYFTHYYTVVMLFILSVGILFRQAYVVKSGIGKKGRTDVHRENVVEEEYEKFQTGIMKTGQAANPRTTADDFYNEHGEQATEECSGGDCKIGLGEGGVAHGTREGPGGVGDWAVPQSE